MTFSFASKLAEADIRDVLQSVEQVTHGFTNVKPFFTCLTYTASGSAANVTCDLGTTAKCAEPGVAACTLHYKDVNVTDSLPIGEMSAAWEGILLSGKGHVNKLMVLQHMAHAKPAQSTVRTHQQDEVGRYPHDYCQHMAISTCFMISLFFLLQTAAQMPLNMLQAPTMYIATLCVHCINRKVSCVLLVNLIMLNMQHSN